MDRAQETPDDADLVDQFKPLRRHRPIMLPGVSLGLNLCDVNRVLTPEKQRELREDLASLAIQRRTLPDGWDTDSVG